ncbi:hypothetical protein G6F16_008153 [Rhizopus arrhizus]|uniref:Uncharacterized protein n=1 Tax=Rhizopus oryzae TaxID=64495 RepID=A0A9P7BW38_RHIOR|nr:hypothetical protein G6F23_010876 [Rhizopus arrhizus]KAG0781105.1 hypothetical protein G6F22_009733 [Rhizopus arrhizus]KAG0794525.1 hypothetical protein G6F21_002808 [Rhizopus arrhizus]KAG0810748.1 hypothetical protein G6F20_007719 [Rhizopus arrhizus]KAG0829113.1 hypothetical protein G6F19_007914 [Rhizopus arrhizus]
MKLIDSTQSPLVSAFYAHLEATIDLIQVVLRLEWTIFIRCIAILALATSAYIIYIIITLRHGLHPLLIWDKLGKPVVKLFRPWTFSYLLSQSDPYARSIDMRISTFSKGFCTAILRDRRRTHDSQQGIHNTAIATFAETVGGLTLMSNLKKKDRAILKNIKIEYKKKARGLLTAGSDYTLPSNLGEGNHDIQNEVVVKDRMLDTVAIVYLTWAVQTKEA